MKYNTSNGTYTDMSSVVTYGTTLIGGQNVTTATYVLTDGGTYDEDGVANGTIVDPAGPAVLGIQSPNTGIIKQDISESIVPIAFALFILSLARIYGKKIHKV